MSVETEDVLGLDSLSVPENEHDPIGDAEQDTAYTEETKTMDEVDESLQVSEAIPDIKPPSPKKRKKRKPKITAPPTEYNQERDELILLVDKLQARVDALEKGKKGKSDEWKKMKSEQMRRYHQQKKDSERKHTVTLSESADTSRVVPINDTVPPTNPAYYTGPSSVQTIGGGVSRGKFSDVFVSGINNIPYRTTAWNF